MVLKLISGFAVLGLAWTLFLWRLMADPIRRVAVTAPNLPKYEDVVAKVEANKRADVYIGALCNVIERVSAREIARNVEQDLFGELLKPQITIDPSVLEIKIPPSFYGKPKPAAKKPRRKPLRKKKKSRRMKR